MVCAERVALQLPQGALHKMASKKPRSRAPKAVSCKRLLDGGLWLPIVTHLSQTAVVQIVADHALRRSGRNTRICKAVSDGPYTDPVDAMD